MNNGWTTNQASSSSFIITEQISTLLNQNLTGVYNDPPRITRDSTNLLSSPIGCNLRPTASSLYENDGNFTPAVLLFSGTVAMTYKGNVYNIPVDIYIPPGYPTRPPVCFVRPAANMEIKSNHKNVGTDGMVYAPYLNSWSSSGCSLVALVKVMANIFSSSPPVFSKPAVRNGNNGAAAAAAADAERRKMEQELAEANAAIEAARIVEEEEEKRRLEKERIEKEVAEANAAAEAARRFEEEERRQEEERKRIEEERKKQKEEEDRRRIEKEIAEANAAAEVARQVEEEERRLEEERRRQKEEEYRLRIEREIAEANAAAEAARREEEEERRREEERQRREEEERRLTVEVRSTLAAKLKQRLKENNEESRSIISTDLKDQKRLDEGSNQLTAQIAELEQIKTNLQSIHQKVDESTYTLESTIHTIESTPAPSIDDLAQPLDIHSNQMLHLSAENASITDCLYFLDRSLAKGNLSLDVHLRRVRRLAKRQFMVRAHLLKIGQARAADRKAVI